MPTNKKKDIIELPMLPVRDAVIFPKMTFPFFIGRKKSLESIETALSGDRNLFVVSQSNLDEEHPITDDLYRVGVVGKILQVMRLPNGNIKIFFEGAYRARAIYIDCESEIYRAEVEPVTPKPETTKQCLKLMNSIADILRKSHRRKSNALEQILADSLEAIDPNLFADLTAPLIKTAIPNLQEILESDSAQIRLELIHEILIEDEENRELEKKLKDRIHGQIGKSNKEYYLNEQMKAIQKELGEDREEIAELEEKIKTLKMTKEARETAEKELKKLQQQHSMSSEANIVRIYLDWLTSVPWNENTKDNFDLKHAKKILDEDHYALEKVKERIIEHIAVAKQVGKIKGPILCLVGPPGVGKTSLARSVSRALNRKFARISLGGVRDEAEIRGHRRTYIGAMPGKIIQTMKKAGSSNPVILLDEVDKMSHSHLGDPASALLETLDTEQNNTFMDHYLEVEYDLSDVLFFCTANNEQEIPIPLLDRMELIRLNGYTEIEKMMIFKKHLFPKQLKENGIPADSLKIPESIVMDLIRGYTMEAGVRSLERVLAKVCRKYLTDPESEECSVKMKMNKSRIKKYLGVPQYRFGLAEKENEIGLATGLAWTAYGGDLLYIEVSEMRGKGNIHLTGKLGDVMKESAQAALSYVRHNANKLGIFSKTFAETDIHIHVPEGAIPKDGPSAGITLTCALVSALTKIPVKRHVAMTGEVTLRGKVLPIGGLKEKLLAAKRGGITDILIPKENKKDLDEVPKEVTKNLKITPIDHVYSVFDLALERIPNSVDDRELENMGKKENEMPIGNHQKITPSAKNLNN